MPEAITKEQHSQKDPHLAFKFWIQIDGVNVAGFTECSPITVETEVFEYPEGGLNTRTHKLPVRAKYANITLKHGLDPGQDLQKWFMDSMDGSPNARKNVSIMIYGQEPDKVVKSYNLLGAYPVKWTGADLRAEPAAVAIETLELAHNGLQPGGNSAGGAGGGSGGAGAASPGGSGGASSAGGGPSAAAGPASPATPGRHEGAGPMAKLQGMLDEAKQKGQEVKDGIEQKVQDKVDQVKEKVDEAQAKGEEVKAKAEEAKAKAEEVKEEAEQTVDEAKQKLGEALDNPFGG